MSINGGRSLELHYQHCGLWNTFLSLLGSGPLGHSGGSKELWDKGSPVRFNPHCSWTSFLFFHFFEPIGSEILEVRKFREHVQQVVRISTNPNLPHHDFKIFIHVEDFSSIQQMKMVGERTDRLVVKQHIGDVAPNILNPTIRQILDNLTLETGHQIHLKNNHFHFHYGFFQKFISSTYGIELE